MRIPFRQGLVTAPPNFLQLSGQSVSLNIAEPELVQVAFADGEANYLYTEQLPVPNAWPGPFGLASWLYWDLDIRTGVRTFGVTNLEPYEGSSAPPSPADGQHWFDSSTNNMKVWNGMAQRWIKVIRVFAARISNGSVLTSVSIDSPVFTGTQVGSLNTPVYAGALVFDTNGDVVKRSNGAFFTTEDVVITNTASSTQVKLSSILTEAVSVSNIPAYSVVRFVDFHQIDLAHNYANQGAYGIIEVDAPTGTLVHVTTDGVVTNTLWDWTAAGVNAPLYITASGQLTPVVQPNSIPVAYVVDYNTIVIRPSMNVFTNAAAGPTNPATTFSLGVVRLSTASATPSSPVVVETTDPRLQKSLNDLTDVTTTGAVIGDALVFNGTEWVAQPASGGLTVLDDNLTASLSSANEGTYANTTTIITGTGIRVRSSAGSAGSGHQVRITPNIPSVDISISAGPPIDIG